MSHDIHFPLIRNHIKAVLFDLDGTLVSSHLDFLKIRAELQCPVTTDLLDFIASLDEPGQQRANAIVQQHEQADAERAKALPGAQQVLADLAQMNIATGIVTRNARGTTQTKLDRAGLHLEHVITREDARPKPHPEALLRLCGLWGIEPQSCIYIGDFHYDIAVARNAGTLAGLYAPQQEPDYASKADMVVKEWPVFLTDFEAFLRGDGRRGVN